MAALSRSSSPRCLALSCLYGLTACLLLSLIKTGRSEEPLPKDPPAPRLASNADASRIVRPHLPDSGGTDPIGQAKAVMAACKASFAKVEDYSFTFYKRERIDGKMTPQHVIYMKIRNQPMSVYCKFARPKTGREAIYEAGRHGGKAVVHDIGWGKLLAGTMKLDPKGSMAMEDCRHPITEVGIGHMIDTIVAAWDKELSMKESTVAFHPQATVGDRPCLLIESVHPRQRSDFLFHMVKVYIDRETNLPIRFEAYDWPKGGRPPELVEEYTYANVKLNIGLKDADFDPNNTSYSFGHF